MHFLKILLLAAMTRADLVAGNQAGGGTPETGEMTSVIQMRIDGIFTAQNSRVGIIEMGRAAKVVEEVIEQDGPGIIQNAVNEGIAAEKAATEGTGARALQSFGVAIHNFTIAQTAPAPCPPEMNLEPGRLCTNSYVDYLVVITGTLMDAFLRSYIELLVSAYLNSPEFQGQLLGTVPVAMVEVNVKVTVPSETRPSVSPHIKAWSGAFDDPHFKLFSGDFFDFMGECNLLLIKAPYFDGDTALDINIRTTVRYDYSYIESAVLKLGNDTLEVASFGNYFLNGIAGAAMPAFVGGYPVTHFTPSPKIDVFEIQINDSESIIMKSFKDMVSIKIMGANIERFRGCLGMMGNPEGKMLGRDGKTVIEDPNEFAAEWQIRDNEPMLFNAVKGPQYPEQCKLPDPAKKQGRRLGESNARKTAERACAIAENKAACIHDVMATGDIDLASAGAF